MKILQLPAYYEPEQIASTALSKALREAFIKAGFTIELYTPTPTRGITNEIREKYKKIKYEEKYDSKLIIHRFSLFKEGKNPVLRAFRYVLENIIQYYKGKKTKDVSIIFSASTPPTQGVMCGLLKKSLKVPFVYNLQDIFPDSLIDTNLAKEGSVIWKLGRKIENYTYKSADHIIVISEGFKKNIMDKGVPEEKITVVPNWADEESITPIKRENNILFDRFGISREKFIVCYSGSVQMTQNWELLVEVANELKSNQDILFVIIGEGDAKSNIENGIREHKLENVKLLPFMPREELDFVFSLGDVGLIISKPNTGESAVPSKTWNIMLASRPIIVSFDIQSELSRLVASLNCGYVSDAGDKNRLKENILLAYRKRKELDSLGKNGRDYVLNNLTMDKCISMYVDIIKDTINSYDR